jgi:hypothetical protein
MTEIPAWHITGDWFDIAAVPSRVPAPLRRPPTTASASRCCFGISGRAITATSASRI